MSWKNGLFCSKVFNLVVEVNAHRDNKYIINTCFFYYFINNYSILGANEDTVLNLLFSQYASLYI